MIITTDLLCRACGCELVQFGYAPDTYVCPRCAAAGSHGRGVYRLPDERRDLRRRYLYANPCATPGCSGRAYLPRTICHVCLLRQSRPLVRSEEEQYARDCEVSRLMLPPVREWPLLALCGIVTFASLYALLWLAYQARWA